jgi:predicted DNA-binding protein YlxM (UPF0122 family)
VISGARFQPHEKTQILNWFLAGRTISEIAAHVGAHKSSVEDVIREGVKHLNDMLEEHEQRLVAQPQS